MNSNETRTLWISLAAGIFAALLLYSYSQEKKKEYDGIYGKMVNVVVARVDIAEMQTVDSTLLEITQRPADFIEPGALQDPEVAEGQVAAVPIKKGEQVLPNKLYQPGPDTGISLQVAPGKRAVSLPVDEIRGVAKLMRPGDRVDIIAAVDLGKGLNQKREVSVIMQDVPILATGVNVQNNIPRIFDTDASGKNLSVVPLLGDTKYSTITIEATPKEAQDLIYLMTSSPGNIYFTLRNPNDRLVPGRLPTSTAESLLGKPVSDFAPAPVSVPATALPPVAAPPPRAPSNQKAQPNAKAGFRAL